MEMSNRIPLKRVIQRAEECLKKDGRNEVLSLIQARKISPRAAKIVSFLSTDCYEFSNSMPRLVHKDDYYKNRELLAHDYVFKGNNPEHYENRVFSGEISKICFLQLELDNEYFDAIAPTNGDCDVFDFYTDDNLKNLYFSKFVKETDFDWPPSKYWRPLVYKFYECFDVYFDRNQVDRHFPYAALPTRKKRGAGEKFPQYIFDLYLDECFPKGTPVPKPAEISKLLSSFSGEKFNPPPDGKTITRKRNCWLRKRDGTQ